MSSSNFTVAPELLSNEDINHFQSVIDALTNDSVNILIVSDDKKTTIELKLSSFLEFKLTSRLTSRSSNLEMSFINRIFFMGLSLLLSISFILENAFSNGPNKESAINASNFSC